MCLTLSTYHRTCPHTHSLGTMSCTSDQCPNPLPHTLQLEDTDYDCETCAAIFAAHVDPEIAPVRPYPPMDHVDSRFEGDALSGGKFVRRGAYQASARSLSSVEEDEEMEEDAGVWKGEGGDDGDGDVEVSVETAMHRSLLQLQLSSLPTWLASQQQAGHVPQVQPYGCVSRSSALSGGENARLGGHGDSQIPGLRHQVSNTISLDDGCPPPRLPQHLAKANMNHTNLPTPKVTQLLAPSSAGLSDELPPYPEVAPPALFDLPSAASRNTKRYPAGSSRTSRTAVHIELPVRRVSLEGYLVNKKSGRGKARDKEKTRASAV